MCLKNFKPVYTIRDLTAYKIQKKIGNRFRSFYRWHKPIYNKIIEAEGEIDKQTAKFNNELKIPEIHGGVFHCYVKLEDAKKDFDFFSDINFTNDYKYRIIKVTIPHRNNKIFIGVDSHDIDSIAARKVVMHSKPICKNY